MRLAVLAAMLAVPVGALAQTMAPITAAPLLPSTGQVPAEQTQAPQAGVPSAPRPTAAVWLPQQVAELQVLDKVNAQSALLTVKVGQEARFGTLSIQVQACDVHPPDQPRDSAAFLTITDSRPDAPGFRGWILADNPSLSMLQHPIYDVRVVGCKA
jgi:hypothetical protein